MNLISIQYNLIHLNFFWLFSDKHTSKWYQNVFTTNDTPNLLSKLCRTKSFFKENDGEISVSFSTKYLLRKFNLKQKSSFPIEICHFLNIQKFLLLKESNLKKLLTFQLYNQIRWNQLNYDNSFCWIDVEKM